MMTNRKSSYIKHRHALKGIPERSAVTLRSYGHFYFPNVSFITLHYLYFFTTCLVASLVFWGASTTFGSVSYTDSLFLVISAMTLAGLNTINLSELNMIQQTILFLLIMMGSAIFVSSAILYIRKRAFERKFVAMTEERNRRRQMRISRPFPLTQSRLKHNTGGHHEDAVASGAVRGRPITRDQGDFAKDEEYELKDKYTRVENDSAMVSEVSAEHGSISQTTSRRHSIANTVVDNANAYPKSHLRFDDHPRPAREITSTTSPELTRRSTRLFSGSGVGARRVSNHPKNAHPAAYVLGVPTPALGEDRTVEGGRSSVRMDKYLKTIDGYIGRNSQFHNLSEKERRKLGGIEYDAICLLTYVVPLYFILWQLLGIIGIGAWIQFNTPGIALINGLNPFWTGAFFAVSAFNNSGMALLDANMVALQTSYYCLLTLGLLILAGNTCFPPFLRLILWTMKKVVPKGSRSPKWQKRRQVLTFILDHPRRVYTNLFPAKQTWWLVFSLVMLNGIDWVAFEILNMGNPTTEALSAHFKVLVGLFQALAVRSGGFYVVNISGLRSGLLVLYVIMMYISAFPVTMTIRNTNVYEERSLGIFVEDASTTPESSASPDMPLGSIFKRRVLHRSQTQASSFGRGDFLRQQLRGQLGHDLWWIALAVLFITIIETGQFERDPVVFATFNIVFETISGYGTVGISTGVPWNNYSFCGAWHTGSKLILCAVMLRGRHRGLPVSIDRAVLLPDESLGRAEEEDAQRRSMSRRRVDLDWGEAIV